MVVLASLLMINCQSVDKGKVGGRDAVVVNYYPRVALFNSVFSGDVEDCLDTLKANGGTEITSLYGTSKDSVNRGFFATISANETCQAIGLK